MKTFFFSYYSHDNNECNIYKHWVGISHITFKSGGYIYIQCIYQSYRDNEEISDERLDEVINVLVARGLIKRLENRDLIGLTEKGRKEFAASALQCLDEKKQYKDVDEMKAAIIVLTILSTDKMEEDLLLDAGHIFEIIVDEAIPNLKKEMENINFSQGA